MASVFETLNNINVNEHVEKKNGLSYLSWAWAWAEVKKHYPGATFTIYENADGLNYHTDGRTCWVKTGVTIEGIEAIEYLPVMDFKNASIPRDKVTSFDVNKAIQRSLTKAAARHGLGLYIYAGEDLPESEANSAPVAAEAHKTSNYTSDAKNGAEGKKMANAEACENTQGFPEIPEGGTVQGTPCCEDCGAPFATFTDRTGRTFTPADQVEIALKYRGARICKKCAAMRKLGAQA